MFHNALCFYEEGFCVRLLESEADFVQAYQLRHRVFCEKLKWVAPSPDAMEIDRYDLWALAMGVFSPDGQLVGLARILTGDRMFMLEREFSALLPAGYALRKGRDTIEITRLTTLMPVEDKRYSSYQITAFLYKGIYQWATANSIRYLYSVVEQRYLKTLNRLGYPWTPIAPVRPLNGGVQSVPLILDMEEFREQNRQSRPHFLDWMVTVRSTLPSPQSRASARESKPPVSPSRSAYGTSPSAR